MSIRYITNNAATGTGSLYEAIKNAQEWDLITPDPDVFPPGSVVDITIANFLPFTVPVTIDAGATRIVINRSSFLLVGDRNSTAYVKGFNARGVTFNGRVLLVGESSTNRIECVFSKCVFSCNGKTYISMQCNGYCDVIAEDCAFIGGLNRGIYITGEGNTLTLNRCTIAANKWNTTATGTFTDCIVDPDLTASPFRNVPTSIDEYNELNPTPYNEWDFTPTLESGYAEGATTAAGGYDLDGLERGRVLEDGSTVYALGAYECIDAAFWAGSDAEGNPITEPRFNSGAGWSSLRNATNGNLDAAPDKCVVVNKRVAFSDAPSITSLRIANASVTLNGAGGVIQQTYLDEGGELINSAADIYYLESAEYAAYSGDWAKVDNARIKTNGSITVDESTQFDSLTIEEGATVELADGVLVGAEKMSVNGGTIRANARAYLGVPKDEPVDAATFENIVIVERSASLTDFKAYSDVTGKITFAVTSLNTDARFLIEELTPLGWATITTEGTSETTTQASYPGLVVYRACDGVNFLQDVAIVPLPVWITTAWAENRGGGEVAGGKAWKVGAWAVDPQTTN